MQQSISCQHCRTEVPTDAAHCPNCGQPMPRHLLPPGEVIGDDYQIVRLLGYGGMGEVYLASHHLTGQLVAIKVLAMHLAEEVDLRIRFLDEARILAKLDHPNIVMLHNFKQDHGRMLILMQYVDGMGLDHIIARDGPMHPERAALLFAPLCDALHHAHTNGIVHRDIKPSNILVDKSAKARLSDFGIAKLTEGGANLTRTGTRVGTSWFMSPEQGLNKPADARSDIYSLGVTLYNALAGRLPFGGASEYEVIKGHVELPPPPIYRSDHPFAVAMEQIVLCALAKSPDERYQEGVEMRDALLDALAAYGEETEVRGAGGTGVFAIHKERGVNGERSIKRGGPSAETVVDEVLPVPTGELQPATPPLGRLTDVPPSGNAPGTRHTPPMPSAVASEPLPRPEVAPSNGESPRPKAPNLFTPPGRPAAPGKVLESTGILRDEAPPSPTPARAPSMHTPPGVTSLPLEVPLSGESEARPNGSPAPADPVVKRRSRTAPLGEPVISDAESEERRSTTHEYPRISRADANPDADDE